MIPTTEQAVKAKIFYPKMTPSDLEGESDLLKEKSLQIVNSLGGLTPCQIDKVIDNVRYFLGIIPVSFEPESSWPLNNGVFVPCVVTEEVGVGQITPPTKIRACNLCIINEPEPGLSFNGDNNDIENFFPMDEKTAKRLINYLIKNIYSVPI